MTWADSDYTYRKKITVDHTKVKADLINYPMLIYVTDADLKDVANSGHVESEFGYDICFYDSTNTTKLKHELVTYTKTTGKIEAYVKIDTLDTDADTEIYMYYGNDDIVTTQNSTDTWNSNYIFVHHLKDLTTSTTADSTANSFTGTKTAANGPAETTGYIEKGQSFDGSDDWINIGDNDKLTPTKHTISFIIKPNTQVVSTAYLFAKEGPRYSTNVETRCYFYSSAVHYNVMRKDGGYIGRKDSDGMTTLGTSDFHLLTMVWDGGTSNSSLKIYIDGQQVDDADAGGAAFTGIVNTVANFGIGTNPYNPPAYCWKGIVDEARFSKTDYAQTWIETEYNNIFSPGTFMDFDIEEIESAGTDYTVILSDSFSIAESLSTLKGTGYSRSLSDTLTILESLVTLSGIGHTRNLTELLTISESLTRQSEYKRSITDTLTIAESLLKQSGYNKSLSDSISISESLSKIHGINVLLSDTLSISDSFSRQVDYKRVISDILTIKDKLVKTYTPGSTIIYDFFDPRITIRNTIANVFDLFLTGDTQKAIEVTYNGNDIQIPIYLVEETKSNNSPLPPMPFIELGLSCGAEPVNVLATGRKRVARVTATIYYTKNDDVDQIAFGKLISDELCNLIRTYQCSMFAIDFINVNNTGRVIEEYRENQVVYVKKMEIYVLHYYL